MVDLSRFNQEIQRIQSEQIGHTVGKETNERKVSQSLFREEFFKKLDLKESPDDIKFSNHAISRLQKRNIDITKKQLERISQAFNKVEEKGSRESLILLDELALIVSVKNKTIVTVMDQLNMKEQVVTNIDSAVRG
jgi:flagellar operon protein